MFTKNPPRSYIHRIVSICILFLISDSCVAHNVYKSYDSISSHEDGTVLLIGCILVEPDVYYPGPYYVTISYLTEDSDLELLKNLYLESDAMGYFTVPNMPRGRYTITQIRRAKPPHILLERSPREWMNFSLTHPYYSGSAYDTVLVAPKGSIVDFGYNVFILERNPYNANTTQLTAHNYTELTGQVFITNKRCYYQPVSKYILEKYPNSEWAPILQQYNHRYIRK